MIPALLDGAARLLVVAALAYGGVVAVTQWAVRTRRLQPFGAWPRLVRRASDPVLQPIERRLVRAGGNPQQAPLWFLGLVVVGGLVLIAGLRWVSAFVVSLGFLLAAGPSAWLAALVRWTFDLLMLALLVRVVASWFGASPWSRWMRVVGALTDWLLDPIRRVLPPAGPFDLSPMVAYFVLWAARALILGAFFGR